MAVSGMNDTAEANKEIEGRRWTRETSDTLRFLVRVGLPLLILFAVLVIAFNIVLPPYLSPRWVVEAPLVLLAMNTLFGIICFVVALIALRACISGASVNLLLFGCGMLSLSLTWWVSGWFGGTGAGERQPHHSQYRHASRIVIHPSQQHRIILQRISPEA